MQLQTNNVNTQNKKKEKARWQQTFTAEYSSTWPGNGG